MWLCKNNTTPIGTLHQTQLKSLSINFSRPIRENSCASKTTTNDNTIQQARKEGKEQTKKRKRNREKAKERGWYKKVPRIELAKWLQRNKKLNFPLKHCELPVFLLWHIFFCQFSSIISSSFSPSLLFSIARVLLIRGTNSCKMRRKFQIGYGIPKGRVD